MYLQPETRGQHNAHTNCTSHCDPTSHRNVHRRSSARAHSLDGDAEDVLVEGASEEAVEQLVVVDRLGDNATDELEVGQVVGVAVGGRVDGVGDAVSLRRAEQRVHRVEDLARDDNVPLAQQAARVLTLLACRKAHQSAGTQP